MLKFGNTYLNFGGTYLSGFKPNLNPLNLPDYTMRFLFKDNVTPTFRRGTGTQISQTPNVWDCYLPTNEWMQAFEDQTDMLAVLGANLSGRFGGVYTLLSTFYGCTALSSVALFDTSTVYNLQHTFGNCQSLTGIPKLNTSLVGAMNNAFFNCKSMVDFPLIDTSNVAFMGDCFENCTSLTSIPQLNTSSVVDASNMFNGCKSLVSVPDLDLTNVSGMGWMFYNCSSLSAIPQIHTTKVVKCNYAFYECYNVSSGTSAFYNQLINQATPPTAYAKCFHSCGISSTQGAAELAQIPSDWK